MPDQPIKSTRQPRRRTAPRNLDRYLDALVGVRPAKLPCKIEPQLAQLVDRAPEGDA
jgi:hypothetical protein